MIKILKKYYFDVLLEIDIKDFNGNKNHDQIIAVTCKYAQNALLIYLHMCIFGNR